MFPPSVDEGVIGERNHQAHVATGGADINVGVPVNAPPDDEDNDVVLSTTQSSSRAPDVEIHRE